MRRLSEIISSLRPWQLVAMPVISAVALTSAGIFTLSPYIPDEVMPAFLAVGAICSFAVSLLLSSLLIYLYARSTGPYKNVLIDQAIKERENARMSMGLLLRAIEDVPVGVTLSDSEGRIIFTNKAEAKLHGYEIRDLLGKNANILAPKDRRRDFSDEEMTHFGFWSRDVENLRKDGSRVAVHLTSDVVKNSAGEPTHIIHISEDITERRLSEARLRDSLTEKETLLKEVHHRVKNNLMTVSSLLSLQLGIIENREFKALLEDSRNRIKAMSLVHEVLYRNENLSKIDLGSYMRALSENLTQTFSTRGKEIRVRTNINVDTLDMDTLIPCGLIVNELVSNSFKHAFNGLDEGTISIDLGRKDGNIALSVSDTGTGISSDMDISTAKTLGMRLVNALVSQINGQLRMESEKGTVFSIKFPEQG